MYNFVGSCNDGSHVTDHIMALLGSGHVEVVIKTRGFTVGSSVTNAVVHSCAELHSDLPVLQNGEHGTELGRCRMEVVEPSYESTYLEVHQQQLERLRSSVQRPQAGNFMHTDLLWASHIRVKGKKNDPKTNEPVSVAYIPWERVQDFVKGEEARTDAPCRFVCQGTSSNKQGNLTCPRWNSYSAVMRCVCNMSIDFHCGCFNVTTLKQGRAFLHLTLSSTFFADPIPDVQVSLPVWTKRQCLSHTTSYKGHVPEETKA